MKAPDLTTTSPEHRQPTRLFSTAVLNGIVAALFLIPTIRYGVSPRTSDHLLALAIGIAFSGMSAYIAALEEGPTLYWRIAVLVTLQIVLIEGLIGLAGLVPTAFLWLIPIRHAAKGLGVRPGGIAGLVLSLLFSVQLVLQVGIEETALVMWLTWVVGLVLILSRVDARQRELQYTAQREVLIAELEQSQRRLKLYAEQAEELAATRERNRVARDIHDGMGHYLMAITVQLEQALAQLKHRPEDVPQTITEARRLASAALGEVRHSVAALRGNDTLFSTPEAFQQLINEVRASGISVQFQVVGETSRSSTQALSSLYRVAQEGLTNIRKHAGTSEATVELLVGDTETRLMIVDSGRGFDPNAVGRVTDGAGLAGMRERLSLVNGRITVESAPGMGTRLIATVPNRPFGGTS